MKNRIFVINPGVTIKYESKHYRVKHILDFETVLAEDEAGRKRQLHIKDLSPVIVQDSEAELKHQEVSLINDEDWQDAERWLELLRPALETERRTTDLIQNIADTAGVHISTVYRKIERYEQTGLTSELISSQSNGGRGKSRLPEDVEAIIQTTIDEYYKKGRKRTVKKTYDELVCRLTNANIALPHRNTLYNRIKALSEKEKDEAQIGPEAAKKRNSVFPGHFPGADWPLAVVQIDHTKLDIELVGDIDRLAIGRPWITLAMDVFSRMVLGFYISFDPPNSMSVGLCLAHAILPKEKWLIERDITVSWPCWGFMRKIHADNAGEFRGKMMRRACKQYNMDLEWRPVKKPHYGAHIERLLGTFLEEIHSLPGTTFSNTKEKGDYNSEKEAVMTESDFERWLTNFIVGGYHQRKHSTLDTSPVKQYERGVFGGEDRPGTGLPPRVFDEDRLRLDLMPYETRTIQQYGVAIEKIHYHSGVLNRYVNAKDPNNPSRRRKFIFKRDPRNIKFLYFYDPETEQYLEVPYRDMANPAMSIWELRGVRNRLKEQGVKDTDVDEYLIFKTYEKMRAIEENAKHETKAARRARHRRSRNAIATRPQTANQAQLRDVSNESFEGAIPDESFPDIESFEIDDSM